MPEITGNIQKMKVSVDANNLAHYVLPVGDDELDMNALVGSEISVTSDGQIHCIHCQRKTKKSFNQGYCYPCLTKLAQCDSCIIKPEKCHYDQGTCREPAWGEANCLQDHFVYLSNTGNVKVGITRHISDEVSSRWIDQGATQAMAIMRTQNRLLSGLVETALKAHIGDKTNWRKMLQGEAQVISLQDKKQEILSAAQANLDAIKQQYGIQAFSEVDMPPVNIAYPVSTYPSKIKSINLDKEPIFSGTLLGIKGQYIMLDGDRVINLRKYAGYSLAITY